MKNILLTKAIFLIFISITFSQNPFVLSKEKTIELYKSLYLTSEITGITWFGNTEKCLCGTIDSTIYKKAEDRINFFRLMTGLNKVKINTKYNTEAQYAALLIKANNQLTHYPDLKMKCYNKTAANGCLKSCLGFSDFKYYASTGFITGFIWDYGDDNFYVGHRKWILYTRLIEFGYGATDNTEALHVADGISRDSLPSPEFVAYPWNGYVPVNLIFPKWSFSIPEEKTVDYSSAIIIMTDQTGHKIEFEKLKEYKDYLDHTIVWSVTGMFTADEINSGLNNLEQKGYLNKKIKVQIKNVRVNGALKNYEYSVEPVKI